MPLELIPNQPYIFEQALPDQPCLNNDIRQGTQILTAGDTVCTQQVITPCTENVICDALMHYDSEIASVAWDVSDGWSSADATHIAYDGAMASGGDLCEQSFGTLVAGVPYQISFDITSLTGDGGVLVSLGLDSDSRTFDEIGSYTCYLIAQDPADYFQFMFSNPSPVAGDTIEITITRISQMTEDCWTDSLYFGVPSFHYSAENGAGKFCSISDGTLSNSSAFATVGNYHRVSFTITDVTQGYLEIVLGGDYMGTVTENGNYSFYGVPTSGTSLDFVKGDSFDGCISGVSVDDFGLLDNTDLINSVYQLTVVNSLQTQESEILSFEVHDDRIIWCFNIDEITGELSPIEINCNDNYRLKIAYADCAGSGEYISLTTFRYNNLGWDCSFVVNAYSDGYAFGFYFGSVTAPLFYLTQRLRVLQFAPRYPAVGEEYLYSNGSFSRSFAQSGKIRTAWFDYVNESTHDVIRLQLLSDVLTVDGDVYFAPLKDYEPEWDDHKYNLAQSRVDLIKDETLFNRSCSYVAESPCTTNTVTTPPSANIAYKLVGQFDLTNVTASNFDMYEVFNTSYGVINGNDATTLGGRNAISSYLQSFFTGAVIGLGGSVTSASVTYLAPFLEIEIYGIGDYTKNFTAFAFMVDVPTIPSNVLIIQPY